MNDTIKNKLDAVRLAEIENNFFFEEECKLLLFEKNAAYYTHIIDNVDIDRTNVLNSYIMWAANKVDRLDKSSPCKFTPGRVSMPDLDMDFPSCWRDRVFDYVCEKYGHDKVCQMITFAEFQGRGALKDVMKIRGVCTHEQANRITKDIPDPAAISDQLNLMKEAGETPSVILWSLRHKPECFREYCYLDENDKLQGPLANVFEQAIRLEGTKIQKGKHAAGVIISNEPLANQCPMVYDVKTKRCIAGIEMEGLEAMGFIKFDFLATSVLDRIMESFALIKERYNV